MRAKKHPYVTADRPDDWKDSGLSLYDQEVVELLDKEAETATPHFPLRAAAFKRAADIIRGTQAS